MPFFEVSTTALHTYTIAGTMRVCATVYTTCGNDIYCTNVLITIPSLVTSPSLSKEEVKVYPNPANDELNVTGVMENTNYKLFSVTGNCVSQGILQQGSNSISMRVFAAGVYILEMTRADGQREIVRVVKD